MAEQLGRYTLEKRIGSGGMADVFLAQGPHGVCVVKRPHPHLCSSREFVKMFLDEASLVAQLNHSGIARVFDLGQVDGVYFIAMEYVPGYDLMTISLEHERQGEYMAPELAAKVIADAAMALHNAHEAVGAKGQALNIIHRDVTPHNILLSRQGQVKIIDFGVAKAADTMHRTQTGLVKGKYPYMAPEQIMGQAIDRRVDVYALGLVLYELLTNARAIAGEIEIEQIENARQMRIKPVEQLRGNTPEPLRIILNSCFQMDANKRYPTAASLAADLEKYLEFEGHRVGNEDLLRLFRVVAAERKRMTEQEIVPAAPTDSTHHRAQVAPAKPAPPKPGSAKASQPLVKDPLSAAPTDVDMSFNLSGGPAVTPPGRPEFLPSPPPPPVRSPSPTGYSAPAPPPPNPAVAASKTPIISPDDATLRNFSRWRAPLGLIAAAVILGGVVSELLWTLYKRESINSEDTRSEKVPTPPRKTAAQVPPSEPSPPPEPVKENDAVAPEPPSESNVPTPTAAENTEQVAQNKEPAAKGVALVKYFFQATSAATVNIDGKQRGETPLEIGLKPGTHTVIFSDNATKRTHSRRVIVRAGTPDTVTWVSTLGDGTLDIWCDPFCDSVTVDGKNAEGKLSHFQAVASEGRHSIECLLNGQKKQRTVELKAGKTERVDIKFGVE